MPTNFRYEARQKIVRRNIEAVNGLVNIKHYVQWMQSKKMYCNCMGPGTPSTMCCEHYYAEEFNRLEWLPYTSFLSDHTPIDPNIYWNLRKKNTVFLVFLILLKNKMLKGIWYGPNSADKVLTGKA